MVGPGLTDKRRESIIRKKKGCEGRGGREAMPRVKKIKRRKARRRLSKIRILKAIPGSGGTLKELARRLECTYHAIQITIKSQKYPEVNERLEEEKEAVGDLAEETLKEVMQQRLDMSTAARTARWWLEKKCSDRGFKDKTELTLEGGENPLHLKQDGFSIDDLNLPLDLRRELLKAIEQKRIGES